MIVLDETVTEMCVFFYVADICQQGLSLDGGWAAEEEEASSPKLLWEQPWPSVWVCL